MAHTMRVEMFPAAHGDALLLTAQTQQERRHILIDGGLASTYRDQLRPRLLDLAAAGDELDLLIVTHVDADHIDGIISLIQDNGSAEAPAVIRIGEVWHNSYRHLPLAGRGATPKEQQRVIDQVGKLPSHSTDGSISARQGSTLAALLRRHKYEWNVSFGGGPVVLQGGPARFTIGSNLELCLLSPTQAALERLAYRWRRELLRLGVDHAAVEAEAFEEAFERLFLLETDISEPRPTSISSSEWSHVPSDDDFLEDSSPTNGSSIAFVAQLGNLRGLFLGDAVPSIVENSLLRALGEGERRHIDLVKVSHHASARNTSPALLRRISSTNWLVSTNGAHHGHPDRDALLRIVAACMTDDCIYFNYPGAAANSLNAPELRQRYGHQVFIGDGVTPVSIELTSRTPHVD